MTPTSLSAHDINSRVDALLRDTAPLHTAAGLGFVAAKDVVDGALASLDATKWSVVDTRGRDDAWVRTTLLTATRKSASNMAIVVDKHAPVSALLFAQAVAERRHGGPARIALGAHVDVTVPESASIIVLAVGARDHDALPRQLQSVDFWEFLGTGVDP